ncbi:cyclophilin-like fold protein [Drancourtella sp. An57]|uniref:cyclophilin-like fold protein n=1 Tax=Drancourtella sp. An57 TaxID=1965647 RepID=UPI00130251FE
MFYNLFINRNHGRTVNYQFHLVPPLLNKQYITVYNCCQLLYTVYFKLFEFVIYYDRNSWNFTRLGTIDHISAKELKQILGDGDVTVTLSL